MSRAQEILRDYLQRRAPGAGPAAEPGLQEENLRRLLRHVAVAHPPSEGLEADLLQAMNRAARERHDRAHRARPWSWLAPGPWRVAVPAALLAVAALAFAWHLRPSPRPTQLAQGPFVIHIRPVHPSAVSPPRQERPLIGYVLLPEGELLRRAAGRQEWQSVEGGDPVHLGDALRTEAEANGSVVFMDGSDCRLAANTTLQYDGASQPEMKRPAHVSLTQGEAWFKIEKGGPTFVVQAPAATAVVTGTEFGIAIGAKQATVLRVREGAVRLRNARGAVLVRAGLQAMARMGQAPQPPIPLVVAKKATPSPASERAPSIRLQGAGQPKPDAKADPPSHPKIGTRDPGAPPADKPAPKPEAEEPASTPIDSSGSGGEAETRMPISTSR